MSSKNLLPRVDRHLIALAGTAAAGMGVVGVTQDADAAVIYSGILNVNIPANFTGIYLNMETGQISNSSSLAGWDINPWVSGGLWRIFPNGASPGANGVVGAAGAATNLPDGTVVGPASAYVTGSTVLLPAGAPALLGIRFTTADAAVHYGWARITTVNGTTAGTLVDYAWENVANAPITAPTPGSLGLLAVGAVGLMRRRRA